MEKLLVWGLDGVSIEIFQRYIKAYPNGLFAKIYSGGHVRDLISTLPFFTAPAWTTFMTGLDPGVHGVYHWRGRYDTEKKERPLISSAHIQDASFWWYYQQFGGKVSVTNFPMEYPAPPTYGKYICGTLAPETAEKVTWPYPMINALRKDFPDYRFEMDKGISYLDRLPELWEHIRQVGWNHFEALMKYGNPYEADLLVHVVTVTDRAEHFFWHLYDDTHPLYDPELAGTLGNPIFETLKMSEEYLEKLWSSGQWSNLVILSDHGMGKSTLAFHTDVWLQSKGYLTTTTDGKVDLENSIAYSGEEPECCLYLNLESREGFGLKDSDYQATLEKMRTELMELRHPDTGEPIFESIHLGPDLYSGPGAHLGPDLVFVPMEGVHPRPRLTHDTIFSDATRLYGNHRPEGISILYGKQVTASPYKDQKEPLHIRDMFSIMCRLADLPIPAGVSAGLPEELVPMLGNVVDESWNWELQMEGLPRHQSFNPQMIDRLKELGYM